MPVERKLSAEQVREIRRSKEPNTRLAAEYGVDRKVIQRIKRHDAYKDVPSLDRNTMTAEVKAGEAAASAANPPPQREYVIADGLTLLETLNDASFETIITAPPCNLGTPPPRDSSRREEYDASYQEYVDYHIDVISECFRIAGPSGVVFYIRPYQLDNGKMNLWDNLFRNFPLRQIITWEHGSVSRSRPELMHHLPRTSTRIYVFAGDYWRAPPKTTATANMWGDVWHIKADQGSLNQIPIELAERCMALGRGHVIDPFAGSGNVALAAIRQHRNWLLAGVELDHQTQFEERRLALESEIYRQVPGRAGRMVPR